MLAAAGSATRPLAREDLRAALAAGCESLPVSDKRVLVIIPDGTRTAPIPLIFDLLYELLGPRVAALDYLIALGTHPPMAPDAIDRLVGVPAPERAVRYPNVAHLQPSVGPPSRADDDRRDLACGDCATHRWAALRRCACDAEPADPGV